jgi:hypothetical protein
MKPRAGACSSDGGGLLADDDDDDEDAARDMLRSQYENPSSPTHEAADTLVQGRTNASRAEAASPSCSAPPPAAPPRESPWAKLMSARAGSAAMTTTKDRTSALEDSLKESGSAGAGMRAISALGGRPPAYKPASSRCGADAAAGTQPHQQQQRPLADRLGAFGSHTAAADRMPPPPLPTAGFFASVAHAASPSGAHSAHRDDAPMSSARDDGIESPGLLATQKSMRAHGRQQELTSPAADPLPPPPLSPTCAEQQGAEQRGGGSGGGGAGGGGAGDGGAGGDGTGGDDNSAAAHHGKQLTRELASSRETGDTSPSGADATALGVQPPLPPPQQQQPSQNRLSFRSPAIKQLPMLPPRQATPPPPPIASSSAATLMTPSSSTPADMPVGKGDAAATTMAQQPNPSARAPAAPPVAPAPNTTADRYFKPPPIAPSAAAGGGGGRAKEVASALASAAPPLLPAPPPRMQPGACATDSRSMSMSMRPPVAPSFMPLPLPSATVAPFQPLESAGVGLRHHARCSATGKEPSSAPAETQALSDQDQDSVEHAPTRRARSSLQSRPHLPAASESVVEDDGDASSTEQQRGGWGDASSTEQQGGSSGRLAAGSAIPAHGLEPPAAREPEPAAPPVSSAAAWKQACPPPAAPHGARAAAGGTGQQRNGKAATAPPPLPAASCFEPLTMPSLPAFHPMPSAHTAGGGLGPPPGADRRHAARPPPAKKQHTASASIQLSTPAFLPAPPAVSFDARPSVMAPLRQPHARTLAQDPLDSLEAKLDSMAQEIATCSLDYPLFELAEIVGEVDLVSVAQRVHQLVVILGESTFNALAEEAPAAPPGAIAASGLEPRRGDEQEAVVFE